MKKCVVKLKHGGLPDSKFNKVELSRGIKVEKEHTGLTCIAKQIAKAHLFEDKKYYIKLKKAGL
jgi:hypothetical protein